jgi:hypothetical protein
MVDEQPYEPTSDHLGEQHLDLGLYLAQASLDIGLNAVHLLVFLQQKSGREPAFRIGLTAGKAVRVL